MGPILQPSMFSAEKDINHLCDEVRLVYWNRHTSASPRDSETCSSFLNILNCCFCNLFLLSVFIVSDFKVLVVLDLILELILEFFHEMGF